ncbi:hypothetical protein ACLBWP_04905 [Microbacterium sp. M1A1_1b]
MAADPDFLVPLDVVPVGQSLIIPDVFRPVAAVIEDDRVARWLTWPDAELPERAVEEAEAWPTPRGVWMVYRSDGIDDLQRSAVFVSLDGATGAIDLGDRRPLGADDDGLWVGDPRDPSAWDHQDEDDDGTLVEVRPETLEWADVEPFWPDRATWSEPTEAATDDDVDGDLDEDSADDDADADSVVATQTQWFIGFSDDDDDARAPEPRTPASTPPTELFRISPSGDRTTIQVDHLVTAVEVVDDVLVLEFHPTGPRSVGWDVVYEPRQVRVGIAAGLPTEVRTDELPSTPVTQDESEWERELDERETRRAPWLDWIDLAGVDGTRWPLWHAGEVSADRAVARLRQQFEGMAEPLVMWSRGIEQPQRVRSDYRDVQVTIEGAWPDTEVVVTFEHTAVPFLRLRRRFRVFDDAGHPRDWTYVTVHLEEDVATGHIPPRSEAVEGVLEI